MDDQDHGKNHTSGHDGHGVHICNKCGWPFPNPHPSARHRRAHKKICGTIDGYKSVSALSDDEHLSDEDHKTPCRQVLETSNDEIKSANRSEDEDFVDAVTEFSDSSRSFKGIEGSSDDVMKRARSFTDESKIALSLEDDATITANARPSKSSADSSQNTESQMPGDALESESQSSQVTVGSVGGPTIDCRTEESGHESVDDKLGPVCDLNPVQLESRGNVSQTSTKKRVREDLAATDAMENKDHNKKRSAVDDLLESETKGNYKEIQTFEEVPVSGKTEDVTSDHVAATVVIESKEKCDYELDSKTLLNVPSSQVGEMASEGSGKLTEIANEDLEVSDGFHVLSVPDDVPVLKNPEIMIEGYKDHSGGRMPQFVDVDPFEVINNVKDSMDKVNPSYSFSSLSDEGQQLFASGTNIAEVNIPQEERNIDYVQESVVKLNPPSSSSSLSNEGEQLFASETHVFRDSNLQEGGNKENVVEQPLDETEPEAVNKGQITEESSVLQDVSVNEDEKSSTVQFPQERLSDDYLDILSESISLEHDRVSKSDSAPVVSTEYETNRFDMTKSEEVKGISEESTGKMTVSPEHHSEGKIHERNDFSQVENAAHKGNDKAESSYGLENETWEGDSLFESVGGSTMMNTTETPEITKDLHETLTTSKTEINVSESESLCSKKASDSQNKPHVEDYPAGVSYNVGDNSRLLESLNNAGNVQILQNPSDKIDDFEAVQKSLEEQMNEESQLSPSNASNSATFGDNPAKDSVDAGLENQTESFPDEGEKKLVAQQLGTSATDFSVDSGSQTDSSSVSVPGAVLSTPPDMQAAVVPEPLASVGEKANATEGPQQTEKSDIIEPPSFMTLVSPTETAQNLQQQQAKDGQAGWFPSLESQGRKKKEETIAEVTAKQHAPLKNLLSEANTESKSKEIQPPVVHKDEPEKTTMALPEPVKKDETGKEWNSPARYPTEIKREKRKAKGRPYWAQFMCCSSVS